MYFQQIVPQLVKLPAEHSSDLESPHSYVIANHMVRDSYISLHIALSHYSLIPEHVAVITSVTTGRPRRWKNEFGRFAYQHIRPEFFFGFQSHQVTQTQWAYVATPEKALLDLIYLTPDADNAKYIRTLRLQNLEQLNVVSLKEYVARMDKPKLRRALPHILQAIEDEERDYMPL